MAKRAWSACEKSRSFNEKWEQEYFVILNADNHSVSCLICGQLIAGLKKSNLERHFKTKHSDFCAESPIDSISRLLKLSELKNKRKAQTKCFSAAQKKNDKSAEASIRISEYICKSKRPLSDGDYIKGAALLLVETVCKDDPAKDRVLAKIAEVPLSHQTVGRRTEDISHNLQNQLLSDLKDCDYFSVALDASCDISDTAQLCVYVRSVKNMVVSEDLLAVLNLHGRTTGELTSKAIIDFLQKHDIPLHKLISCTTDGARAMIGEHKGCIALLKESGLFPNLAFGIHCIIHQESLCSKSASLEHVMSFVQKTVNFIKKNSALTHRQFKSLLEESNSVAKDLLLYTEVR